LLGLAGTYAIVTELFGERKAAAVADPSVKRLVLIGSALSIDNLVIGFALGTYHINLAVAAFTIGVVSVGLSLLGLELGTRLGHRLGQRGELVGGAVLVLVGVVLGFGLL
jgi:putative Mn2+ efflux pump MntP